MSRLVLNLRRRRRVAQMMSAVDRRTFGSTVEFDQLDPGSQASVPPQSPPPEPSTPPPQPPPAAAPDAAGPRDPDAAGLDEAAPGSPSARESPLDVHSWQPPAEASPETEVRSPAVTTPSDGATGVDATADEDGTEESAEAPSFQAESAAEPEDTPRTWGGSSESGHATGVRRVWSWSTERMRSGAPDGAAPETADADGLPIQDAGESDASAGAGPDVAPALDDDGSEPQPTVAQGPVTSGDPAPTPAPARTADVDAHAASSGPEPSRLQRGTMRRRVRYLLKLHDLQLRDLGGLMFDLHRFGRQRDDLVAGKLAALSETDRELRALRAALQDPSRVREVREAGIGGTCPRCHALHSSEARFCASCGAPLTGDAASAPAAR